MVPPPLTAGATAGTEHAKTPDFPLVRALLKRR
jgi:hypothetical protein